MDGQRRLGQTNAEVKWVMPDWGRSAHQHTQDLVEVVILVGEL